jgi:hypothetical protein
MKVSVSLPGDRAVRLLRAAELAGAYEGAWDEWAGTADAEVWSSTVGDTLGS